MSEIIRSMSSETIITRTYQMPGTCSSRRKFINEVLPQKGTKGMF